MGEFQRRIGKRDVVFPLVPAVLLGVHALPESVRRGLVFSYTEPTVTTAFTSHFVHLGGEHLFVNLASYVLLAPTAYVISAFAGRREPFLKAFVLLHLVAPFALSGANLLFVRPRIAFGYSGVAMGLLAMLGLELFSYGRRVISPALDLENAVVLFLIETLLITAALVPRLEGLTAVAAVCAAAVAVYGWHIHRNVDPDAGLLGAYTEEPGYAELGAVGLGLLLVYPFVAFPPDPAGEGSVLNLYTHLLGFCLAFIVGYVAKVEFRFPTVRGVYEAGR